MVLPKGTNVVTDTVEVKVLSDANCPHFVTRVGTDWTFVWRTDTVGEHPLSTDVEVEYDVFARITGPAGSYGAIKDKEGNVKHDTFAVNDAWTKVYTYSFTGELRQSTEDGRVYAFPALIGLMDTVETKDGAVVELRYKINSIGYK
ncbi:MAG: hypothetical protein ACOCX1_00825 [Fimbriimonadaceae bacterium]